MRRAVAVLAAAILLAAGCSSGGGGGGTVAPPLVTAASLERFAGCEELVTHLRAEAADRVGPFGLPGVGGFAFPFTTALEAAPAEARAAVPAADSAGSGPAFSQTNIQETGVDEPDMVKTDGRHIFTVRTNDDGSRTELVAVSVADGRPSRAGSIDLPEGAGTDLLLAGGRAMILGGGWFRVMPMAADIAIAPSDQRSTVVVVDVSDPASMSVTDVIKLDGSYASARLVDGVARIVVNASTGLGFEQPVEPTASAERTALQRNKKLIDEAPVTDWLPAYEVSDAAGEVRDAGPIASCDQTFHPTTFSGFGTTSVVTIDPADPDPKDSATVLGGAGVVYASTGNLYVATQRWPEARPLVIEDEPVGMSEVQPVTASTQIHRFDISDARSATYAASGEVDGTVLNQWSMSEHEGHLRVATTEESFGRREVSSSSSVTVLDATGPSLARVGHVGNLGPGERIYGVRFMGDVGYVVTFRQIDPLYVVDLSTPARPRVLGELKIPGYSAYLHPVGDGLLLGVGQDATEDEGRPLGTQVSLFDVSDPGDPRQLDKVVMQGSSTPVEHDHHAFLWWERNSLAVVPIERYEDVVAEPVGPDGVVSSRRADIARPSSAAVAFRIGDGQVREVGRVSHDAHVSDRFAISGVQRSIVIRNVLFTLSHVGIASSDIRSFEERGWLAL